VKKQTSSLRQLHVAIALCELALVPALSGCFRDPNPRKLVCNTNDQCPTGYWCTAANTCVSGPGPMDASKGSSIDSQGVDTNGAVTDAEAGVDPGSHADATDGAREVDSDAGLNPGVDGSIGLNDGVPLDGRGGDAGFLEPTDAPLSGEDGAGGSGGGGGGSGGGGGGRGGSAAGGASGRDGIMATGGSTGSDAPVATGGVSSGGGGVIGSGGASPTGGVSSPGGTLGNGGISSIGGVTSNGGTMATGGIPGSGGISSTGGSTSSGGTTATGGTTGTGGTSSTGGVSASGGSQAGGTQGSGGAGSGGTTPVANLLVTSASGAYWMAGTLTETPAGVANVTVNDATTAQTWEGFGGAFNEMGWSYLTSRAMQDQAMQLLFGMEGCRFAWGRIPMGASEYAMSRYTDDEVSSGSTDISMSMFSIDRDKQKLIPYIKAAQAVKSNIRFWASPWTPPTWMKTGPFNPGTGPSNSPFDGGVMKGDDATLAAYAQYFVKFIQAYGLQGINIEVVAPQQEPNYQQNYPSCHWETATFVRFVGSFLGPSLASAGLTTMVMDGTLSNPTGDADIGSSVLNDSTAKSYCSVIGVQWGMSAASQISALRSLASGKPMWLTEHKCGGTLGSTAPAPNDLSYAKDSWGYIRDAIKNGLTAYNAWNMVLDPGGLGIDDTRRWPQNALLVADPSAGSVTATPAYYVFRHFSQYVEPGAEVISTSGGDAVAFRNPDGSLVAVMYNSGSANDNYVVAIGGKKLRFPMPGSGWATVKYNP
jgi:glucosylceramidase